MALQWPEDDEPSSTPTDKAGPVFATREIWEDPWASAGGRKSRRFANVLPVALSVGILLILGVILAITGPLPSIFPRLDCGACVLVRN